MVGGDLHLKRKEKKRKVKCGREYKKGGVLFSSFLLSVLAKISINKDETALRARSKRPSDEMTIELERDSDDDS